MHFKVGGATFETGRPQSLSPNATALEPGSRSTWREPCGRRHVHLPVHPTPPSFQDIEIALPDEDSCRCRCCSVGLGRVSSPLSAVHYSPPTTTRRTAWQLLCRCTTAVPFDTFRSLHHPVSSQRHAFPYHRPSPGHTGVLSRSLTRRHHISPTMLLSRRNYFAGHAL